MAGPGDGEDCGPVGDGSDSGAGLGPRGVAGGGDADVLGGQRGAGGVEGSGSAESGAGPDGSSGADCGGRPDGGASGGETVDAGGGISLSAEHEAGGGADAQSVGADKRCQGGSSSRTEQASKGTGEAPNQGNRLKGNVYVRVGTKIGCRRGKPPARDHIEERPSISDDNDFVLMNHCSGPIEVPKDSAPRTRSATRGGTKKARPDEGDSHVKRNITFMESVSSPKGKKRKAGVTMEDDVSVPSRKPRRTASGAVPKSTHFAPRWNFHCSLSTLDKVLGILNKDQKQEFVHAAGFQSLLEINLNKDIPPVSILQN